MDLKRESVITFYNSCSNTSCNSKNSELSEKKMIITDLEKNPALLNQKNSKIKTSTNYFFRKNSEEKEKKIEIKNVTDRKKKIKKFQKRQKNQKFIKFSSQRKNQFFEFFDFEEDKLLFKKNLIKKLHKTHFDNDVDSDTDCVKEAIWFNYKNFLRESQLYL